LNKQELLIELANRCREERLRRNIPLKGLHNITRIPIDVLKNLEENEDYIINNPYSKYLLKFIAKNLNIDISDIEAILNKPEEEKVSNNLDIKKGINTTISTVLAMSTILYAANVSKIKSHPDKFEIYLKLISEENNTQSNKSLYDYNPNPSISKFEEKKIKFVANDKVWLTAYIDGVEKVIKLSPNEEKEIKFFNKIKVETVGNADELFINFKGKTVKLTDNSKILHNIFIDEEGIFINGYNILQNKGITTGKVDLKYNNSQD